ncbi:hypothetical protein NOK12_29280 [Nocardioides sp. OK12]|uniref:phospholipase D family protein n=1 Tax=Nocardioides sp. OK12 TaxID=2758661 RepID=UPI0021C2C9B3|nr:phospholipase D family protein [Nocardioides sp. OK12]GHJ60410.1 hypothetical protein NOK12_29280 [Nocardioides sp. OK12]
MRYLDSGSRDPADTLYTWLEQVLPEATYFGCQTGYFSYDGIYPLEGEFLNLLNRFGAFRLVVGANESGIRKSDLEDVFDLFDKAPSNVSKSLTLVAADDILMHPKSYYVERADGSKHALVGSANLTHPGLSRNIEAALVIDSVNDPGAPFSEIRTAIEKWHLHEHVNAYRIARTDLAKLATDGMIDQPKRPRPAQPPLARRERSKRFPGLGAIIKLPRKRRAVVAATPVRRPRLPAPVPVGTLGTMPNGAIGIIKRLTALDTKGFNGGTGTLYIALPKALTRNLPMAPYGKNQEPRIDVTVEARLDTVPGEVVLSGDSPTNITHVGAGATRTSHGDLRFNYLVKVKRGIETLAADYRVRPPAEDDLVAIEFLGGQRVRATFITETVAIANLTPLLDQHDNGWGWLPPSVIAPWADDEDDA